MKNNAMTLYNKMHIEPSNNLIGLVITVTFGVMTFIDVELLSKVIASLASTIAAGFTIYNVIRNNRNNFTFKRKKKKP